MTDRFLFPARAPVSAEIAQSDMLFPVRRIFCVGRNYADHVREMGSIPTDSSPIFFTKPADALVANGSSINFPMSCTNLHHEVELVIALDQPVIKANPQSAKTAIFGMATGIDLTRRDLQKQAKNNGQPWDIAKAFDQSAPMGAITPLKGFPTKLTGAIQLSVNGEQRQAGDLSQMLWTVPELISQLSHLFQLLPGDLIFTGTPAGVGPLLPGDQVSASIEGTSPLKIQILAAE